MGCQENGKAVLVSPCKSQTTWTGMHLQIWTRKFRRTPQTKLSALRTLGLQSQRNCTWPVLMCRVFPMVVTPWCLYAAHCSMWILSTNYVLYLAAASKVQLLEDAVARAACLLAYTLTDRVGVLSLDRYVL
jgi:hypothetical protein